MRDFIEHSGLNLLGDTIAGFLGLATFIVVVFTYFAQKAMARQTVEEMKQQNRLSAKIANANYQLALHEPRLKAYEHFNNARALYIAARGETPEVVEAMRRAVKEAEFLYDSDLQIMLQMLANGLHNMQKKKSWIDHQIVMRERGTLSDDEKAELDKDLEHYEKESRDAFAAIESKELMAKFAAHLRLVQTLAADETAKVG